MTEAEKLIMEANQKQIQEHLDRKRQTQLDMIEGTKQLAEKRQQALKALADKQNQYKETVPVSEAEELKQLRERASLEDERQELEALRKRFAKDGE